MRRSCRTAHQSWPWFICTALYCSFCTAQVLQGDVQARHVGRPRYAAGQGRACGKGKLCASLMMAVSCATASTQGSPCRGTHTPLWTSTAPASQCSPLMTLLFMILLPPLLPSPTTGCCRPVWHPHHGAHLLRGQLRAEHRARPEADGAHVVAVFLG